MLRNFLHSILRSDPPKEDPEKSKDYCWTHRKIEKPVPPKK